MDVARRTRARSIFVQCWDRGPAASLYGSLGFHPIADLRPAYDDGSGQRVMGYPLRGKLARDLDGGG